MMSNRYPWDAEDYAQHSSEQNAWAQDLIQKLMLHGSEWILDLGCGDGKAAACLARQVPDGRVIGVDSAWSMVALARRQFPLQSVPGLSFVQMDAARLGFDQAFQVVFSNAMMHWVKDHSAVLQGIWRSLVPGGCCLLQMGGRGNAAQMITTLDRVMAEPRWREFFSGFRFPYRFYGVAEYEAMLSVAQLTAKRVELILKDMQHPGAEGLAGWLRTAWLPYVGCVPPQLRESFILSVVEAYLKEFPPDSEGVVHVPMVRLEVEAVRL